MLFIETKEVFDKYCRSNRSQIPLCLLIKGIKIIHLWFFCVFSCLKRRALLILGLRIKRGIGSRKPMLRKLRIVKNSISRKFAGIFFLLMSGTILLCWFLNITFLEKFYIRDKQTALLNAYAFINSAIEQGTFDSEEFELEFHL